RRILPRQRSEQPIRFFRHRELLSRSPNRFSVANASKKSQTLSAAKDLMPIASGVLVEAP
ncbi:MAG TPA: hypothetical protein VEC60_19470, partial [Reyranella sp.]|nr:hypothetical protein [Reyranella sp.]